MDSKRISINYAAHTLTCSLLTLLVTLPVATGAAETPNLQEGVGPTVEFVARRAEIHIENAVDLANHGAIFAAQDEFILALEAIGHARDSGQRGGPRYHQAIVAGLKALKEADDFVTKSPLASKSGMKGVVAAHQTPVLKDADIGLITPPIAIQRYCDYAHQQLYIGCQGVPIAAKALFGLGRIEQAMARNSEMATVGCPKAMILFESAVRIDPKCYEAANELGVLLARYGKFENAALVLNRSIRAQPTAEGYYNLAVVYDQLGFPQKAEAARAESQKLGTVVTGSQAGPVRPIDIEVVDLATFEERSPADSSLSLSKPSAPKSVESDSDRSNAPQRSAEPSAAASGHGTKSDDVNRQGDVRTAFGKGGPIRSFFSKRNANTTTRSSAAITR